MRLIIQGNKIAGTCNDDYMGDELTIDVPIDYDSTKSYVYVDGVLSIAVPQTVSPRQARLALLQATLLDEVELLLANDKAMQIWWEYSLDIQRNHEYITTMGTALGLTELQLDDLFILGATL